MLSGLDVPNKSPPEITTPEFGPGLSLDEPEAFSLNENFSTSSKDVHQQFMLGTNNVNSKVSESFVFATHHSEKSQNPQTPVLKASPLVSLSRPTAYVPSGQRSATPARLARCSPLATPPPLGSITPSVSFSPPPTINRRITHNPYPSIQTPASPRLATISVKKNNVFHKNVGLSVNMAYNSSTASIKPQSSLNTPNQNYGCVKNNVLLPSGTSISSPLTANAESQTIKTSTKSISHAERKNNKEDTFNNGNSTLQSTFKFPESTLLDEREASVEPQILLYSGENQIELETKIPEVPERALFDNDTTYYSDTETRALSFLQPYFKGDVAASNSVLLRLLNSHQNETVRNCLSHWKNLQLWEVTERPKASKIFEHYCHIGFIYVYGCTLWGHPILVCRMAALNHLPTHEICVLIATHLLHIVSTELLQPNVVEQFVFLIDMKSSHILEEAVFNFLKKINNIFYGLIAGVFFINCEYQTFYYLANFKKHSDTFRYKMHYIGNQYSLLQNYISPQQLEHQYGGLGTNVNCYDVLYSNPSAMTSSSEHNKKIEIYGQTIIQRESSFIPPILKETPLENSEILEFNQMLDRILPLLDPHDVLHPLITRRQLFQKPQHKTFDKKNICSSRWDLLPFEQIMLAEAKRILKHKVTPVTLENLAIQFGSLQHVDALILRLLYNNCGNIEHAVNAFIKHLEWNQNKTLFNEIAEKAVDCVGSLGYFYQFGCTYWRHPVIVLKPKILLNCDLTSSKFIEDLHTAMRYFLDTVHSVLFIPGCVEQWVILIDATTARDVKNQIKSELLLLMLRPCFMHTKNLLEDITFYFPCNTSKILWLYDKELITNNAQLQSTLQQCIPKKHKDLVIPILLNANEITTTTTTVNLERTSKASSITDWIDPSQLEVYYGGTAVPAANFTSLHVLEQDANKQQCYLPITAFCRIAPTPHRGGILDFLKVIYQNILATTTHMDTSEKEAKTSLLVPLTETKDSKEIEQLHHKESTRDHVPQNATDEQLYGGVETNTKVSEVAKVIDKEETSQEPIGTTTENDDVGGNANHLQPAGLHTYIFSRNDPEHMTDVDNNSEILPTDAKDKTEITPSVLSTAPVTTPLYCVSIPKEIWETKGTSLVNLDDTSSIDAYRDRLTCREDKRHVSVLNETPSTGSLIQDPFTPSTKNPTANTKISTASASLEMESLKEPNEIRGNFEEQTFQKDNNRIIKSTTSPRKIPVPHSIKTIILPCSGQTIYANYYQPQQNSKLMDGFLNTPSISLTRTWDTNNTQDFSSLLSEDIAINNNNSFNTNVSEDLYRQGIYSYCPKPSDVYNGNPNDPTTFRRILFGPRYFSQRPPSPSCNYYAYTSFEQAALVATHSHLYDAGIALEGTVFADEAELLRFLQISLWDPKICTESVLRHLEWRSSTFPITKTELEENNNVFLKAPQICYLLGYDRYFRPVLISRLKHITMYSDSPVSAFRYLLYTIEYALRRLMIPGKVEQFTVIVDAESVSIFALPSRTAKKFIWEIQNNYPERLSSLYIVNASNSFKIYWSLFIYPHLSKATREKVNILDYNFLQTLRKGISRSQLEKFLGGRHLNMKFKYGQIPYTAS